MASSAPPQFGEFQPSNEDWVSYTERLEQFFIVHGIAADASVKRRAMLLSFCGAMTYQLIRDLVSPNKPTTKTYTELVKLVKDHHQPPPSEIVQRFHFNSRIQKADESVGDFVAQLRRLSEHCNYGNTLELMLRDRLVCGCKDRRLQCKLLAEPDLTFKKAFKLAAAMESAERDAKDLQPRTLTPIHKFMDSRSPQEPPKQPSSVTQPCYRCGGKHLSADCRFREANCNYCNKKGHISRVCRSKLRDSQRPDAKQKTGKTRTTHNMTTEEGDTTPDVDDEYFLYHIPTTRAKPISVTVAMNDTTVPMELDTGASLSIMSEQTYQNTWPKHVRPPLCPTKVNLKTYTGERIVVRGAIDVSVTYKNHTEQLTLLVVAGSGPTLLGRDWLKHITLDWYELNRLSLSPTVQCQEVVDRHPDLFSDGLGLMKGAEASLNIDPDAQPRFCKARPVPHVLRGKVETELDRLTSLNVIEPVQFSNWAAPIVPVVKRDGSVRICGDYKLTVNKASKTDPYPLPRIEDIFASLSGGKLFTKLDLAHAYLQVPLEESSKEYTTISTHKGLFQYKRLPFGVASAPAIFQRVVDNLLQGIPHACAYLDDILVTGKDVDDHLHNLDAVLTRLEKAGVRLKPNKCAFMLPSVDYLGHRISSEGLQPTEDKVRAIKEAPAPTSVTQLKSFLGSVNYYHRFMPNLSSVLSPLYRLLQRTVQWTWGRAEQQAFNEVKNSLTADSLLVHYDPNREMILACDASPYGIGAVLSHRMDDGAERPIAFTSRSLSPAEKNYSQLDKEGLAVVFGVRKFHQYLYGLQFQILSDHKPLHHLFSADKAVPNLASARIQRWALLLSAYRYSIQYKPGSRHANADALSRLPLPECPAESPLPGETVLLMDILNSTPVSAAQIKAWTDKDPTLSKVRTLVIGGWSEIDDPAVKPYLQRRTELSVQDGCLLRGSRVIVPAAGRKLMLEELHEGHPGITRMKALARSYVWWPQLDRDLEEVVKTCNPCQLARHSPAPVPLQPWEWPQRPWSRLHIDFAGPFLGHMYLVLVDAHSKWLEVKRVSSATTAVTTEVLRSIFATHGLPEMLVSDNGTAFTSSQFKHFTSQNGIRHVTSAPYHPATNGLAERAVQTFKEYMKKTSKDSIDTRISRFLFRYRLTPHSTTGVSPSELLFGRRIRSQLDFIRPSIQQRVLVRQEGQKASHDQRAKDRTITLQSRVLIRNFAPGDLWLPGTVTQCLGKQSFLILLDDGRTTRRHIDHVRPLYSRPSPTDQPDWLTLPDVPSPPQPPPETSEVVVVPRRSNRVSRPPERYGS